MVVAFKCMLPVYNVFIVSLAFNEKCLMMKANDQKRLGQLIMIELYLLLLYYVSVIHQ